MNIINILWFSTEARDTLLESLAPHSHVLDIKTEVDDRRFWLFPPSKDNGIHVYADKLTEIQCDALADRLVELERSHGLDYATLDVSCISPEFLATWLSEVQKRTQVTVYPLPLADDQLQAITANAIVTAILED